VQNLSYTYDLLGNPLSRSDANTSMSETLAYDGLNRLTSATVNLSPAPLVKTFAYSAIGNMLSKSDVGTYSYPAAGSPLPHAVMNVSGGNISSTFTYDANGNQTAGLGRSIVYTSYNKPASITQGTRTISFLDDTDHQRFKQVTPEGSTLYISAFGVLTELTNPGAAGQKWTDYLSVGGAQIGIRVLQTASATLSTRYFHTDPLGSISAITNESGQVVERLSYDAWGKRRNPNGTDDPSGSIVSQSTRGFTGEEELSVAGLVHLNGRVYDPTLARMTSADPTVQSPMSTQGWNRYAYVNNRPLNFTDPTGYQAGEYDGTSCLCVLDNYGLNNLPLPSAPPLDYQLTHMPVGGCYCNNTFGMVYPTPLPIVTPLPQFDVFAAMAANNAAFAAQQNAYAAQQAAIQAQFNALQAPLLVPPPEWFAAQRTAPAPPAPVSKGAFPSYLDGTSKPPVQLAGGVRKCFECDVPYAGPSVTYSPSVGPFGGLRSSGVSTDGLKGGKPAQVPQIVQQQQGKPTMTQWGWQNSPSWRAGANEVGTAGHNATLIVARRESQIKGLGPADIVVADIWSRSLKGSIIFSPRNGSSCARRSRNPIWSSFARDRAISYSPLNC
jgi:RHS repeat-associated protein